MRTLLGVLIALAAACGDDENRNPLADAPIAPDAPPDGPTSGPVTITITQDGVGVQDVLVHFQNADSTVVRSVTTDVDGVATTEMEPGGFVSAIDPFPQPIPQLGGLPPNDRAVFTFAGVKPGDQLRLTDRDTTPLVSVNVTFTPDPEASFYSLNASCMPFQIDVTDPDGSGGSGGPGGIVVLDGCADGVSADLVVTARDGKGFPIKTLQLTTTLTEGATVDLGATYADMQDVTYAWTGVPAQIGNINVQGILASSRGVLSETFDGASPNAGTAMTAPQPRAVLANVTQITASTFFGPAFSRHTMLEWGAPVQAYTGVLDATTLVGDYGGQPEFDIAGHRATFTTGAGGAAPDFTIAFSTFLRDQKQGLQLWSWSLASPFVDGAAVYPVLPPDSADLNPVATDLTDVEELITGKVPGGYDAIRGNLLALDSPLGLVTGASGRVVFQELARGKSKRGQRPSSQVLRPWVDRPATKLQQKARKRR
jgi:hypothetical protein